MSLQEEIIEVLTKLVSYDTSINPENNIFPSDDCAKYIVAWGQKHGYSILDVTNCHYKKQGKAIHEVYPVVLYTKGKQEGPTVLFLGHIDVVPVSESELPNWNSSPFEAVVKDGKLWGRGSGDMKGGVVAFLLAFKDIEIEKGNVIIALSGDEEIGGMDTVPQMIAAITDNNMRPDFVINAEGSFEPVVVTKRRGGTQIEFTFDLDYQTVDGVLETKIIQSTQGGGSESLHSMGFLLGSDIHAMISAGKHSMDKPVVNVKSSSSKANSVPSEVTIEMVNTLVPDNEKTTITYSKGLTGIMNALASIGSLNWPIVPSKFGPSVCPNLMDIDEEKKEGTITFDIRSMLKDNNSHEEMVAIISDQFERYGVNTKTNITLAIDPVNVDPNHPLSQKITEIARKNNFDILTIGEKLGGASDTRFFTSLDIPGVELGPITYSAHGTNEAVELKSIEKLISIYQQLFVELTS
ncbi:MAG: M20/M25/M40 family metallo-hydrolase [Candidatus Heimdallarchaeota archaeon]|nr:M20/M25/M40 family metallo-hydrolase [Candidatus Heimdallarchaeota archaeon]